jgi:hypothetical protein
MQIHNLLLSIIFLSLLVSSAPVVSTPEKSSTLAFCLLDELRIEHEIMLQESIIYTASIAILQEQLDSALGADMPAFDAVMKQLAVSLSDQRENYNDIAKIEEKISKMEDNGWEILPAASPEEDLVASVFSAFKDLTVESGWVDLSGEIDEAR